jgi:HEPN domain-containing protein
MLTNLSHLTEYEVGDLVKLSLWLSHHLPTEKIICFGSRGKLGNWSPFAHKDYKTLYTQQCYDLLLLTDDETRRDPGEMQDAVDSFLTTCPFTANVIIQKMKSANKALEEGRPFETHLYYKTLLLYDRGTYALSAPGRIRAYIRDKDKATERWERKNILSWSFFKGARFYKEEGEGEMAVLSLNQSLLFILSAMLRFHTGYRSTYNDIGKLLSLTNNFTSFVRDIFPANTPEEKELLQLLVKGDSNARYKIDYTIPSGTVDLLLQRVELLRERAIEARNTLGGVLDLFSDYLFPLH